MSPFPVLVLAALFAAGCVPLPTAPPGEPIGRFRTRLSKLEVETFDATACESGERQSFLGVDLRPADTGPVVRLVVDPLNGPAVRVFDPADPARRSATYRSGDCRKFQVDLNETGATIDAIRDYRLDLDIDCEHGNGSMLAGTAKLEHCH